MKRFFSLSLAVLSLSLANADYKPGYYDDMDGTARERLKEAAKRCVETHTKLNYSDLPNYWIVSDIYPDLYDGERRFWDMYSDNVYLIHDNQTGKQAFSANKMQREHSVPKSWWKKNNDVEYTPCYSDMWNLFPSDGSANNAKSNYPFGIVATASFDNGVTKVGTPSAETGGDAYKVFEPADEYKGDFARSIFYVATVYDGLEWGPGYDNTGKPCNTMFVKATYPTLTEWAIEMLLEWSRKDPISEKEIARNDAVETCQGNRNPFVDFPKLAEYVWGNLSSDIFFIDDQNGVNAIDADESPVYKIEGGEIQILRDSNRPLTVMDISGRILLMLAQPRSGDVVTIPATGLVIVHCGAHSQKTLIF
ncbi:MAG: endonuclease [Muribaculum sp.]|nr:endonuclease [Muribaculum sp.]